MRPFLVVPVDPVPNDPPRLLKRLERMLPDTLVFQTPKEPLNLPILLAQERWDRFDFALRKTNQGDGGSKCGERTVSV